MESKSTKFVRVLSSNFSDFCNDVDKTYKYYLMSKKAINENFRITKEKHKEAFFIADQFDSLYKTKPSKIDETIKNILNKDISSSNKKIKDVIEDIGFENDIIAYRLKSTLTKNNKYDPNFARDASFSLNYLLKTAKTSFLSNVVMVFEQFLSNLYYSLIYYHMERYIEGKTIPLKSLLNSNVDDIFSSEVDYIVEKDMYDSFSLLNKIFEKENIGIEYANGVLEEFGEIYYRRNAYVHNRGFANQQYLCKNPKSKTKLGDYLKCDDNYLKNVAVTVKKLIFFISFSLIAKNEFDSDDLKEIIDYCFDSLCNNEYDFCEYVYKYLSLSNKLENVDRMIARVNLLICLKETKKTDSFNEEIRRFDVSAADNMFVIAKHILLDQFKEANDLIVETYDKEKTPAELMHWPLYQHFRETSFFTKIKENKAKDFNLQEIDQNDQ